ncbi:MAG: UDP-N-acetylglucosamine 2-epimerase (non-hydrolyzing) [Bacteroidetes bacterium]|nr:UDP-N-acetylglucosamine 2-epimerase (non-hydrolyzing) [Bacteroidota bacterium]
MIKLITIIGARPQIIKAAALSRAINTKFNNDITEIIVHTGQHYDENMSGVFFDELGIPKPKYNLNIGSGGHGKQTAAMITGIEEILLLEKPNAIILYGDTNSTLAGAIAASKIHVPVVHVEAGLRSFNKAMPEEVNRIMADHISTLLFTPTKTGFNNLLNEGFKQANSAPYTVNNPKIYHCGDVMYDNSIYYSNISDQKSDIIQALQLQKNKFILATIHRNNNTDEPIRLNALFNALNTLSKTNSIKIVLPLHPRTSKLLEKNLSSSLLNEIKLNTNFIITEPAGFLEMIALEKNCLMVMTDSGGVQKEAFYFKKPCAILRPETEWVELVECGAALICDANEEKIITAFNHFTSTENLNYPQFYGDGKASEFICEEIIKHLA